MAFAAASHIIHYMAQIHATAIVSDRAELADDVVIGPWCIVEGSVIIGPGTRLLHRVSLRGPITIGADNHLYPNVCLGFAPQDAKFDHDHDGPGVAIGDGNLIREGVTIHRATSDQTPTTVGDENYIMANAHIGHDVQMGSNCMLANGALAGGHVEIADRAILGGGAAAHQFCRIGRLSMLSGLMGIVQDVPPFCTGYSTRTIGSLNLIGLRRAGYQPHIENLQLAFNLLFRAGLPNGRAIEMIAQECNGDALCREMAEFVRGTRRGIPPYASHSDVRALAE